MFAVFFSQKFVLHHSVDISVRTLNKYPPACHVDVMDKFIGLTLICVCVENLPKITLNQC